MENKVPKPVNPLLDEAFRVEVQQGNKEANQDRYDERTTITFSLASCKNVHTFANTARRVKKFSIKPPRILVAFYHAIRLALAAKTDWSGAFAPGVSRLNPKPPRRHVVAT
jgi:hypothetical protein